MTSYPLKDVDRRKARTLPQSGDKFSVGLIVSTPHPEKPRFLWAATRLTRSILLQSCTKAPASCSFWGWVSCGVDIHFTTQTTYPEADKFHRILQTNQLVAFLTSIFVPRLHQWHSQLLQISQLSQKPLAQWCNAQFASQRNQKLINCSLIAKQIDLHCCDVNSLKTILTERIYRSFRERPIRLIHKGDFSGVLLELTKCSPQAKVVAPIRKSNRSQTTSSWKNLTVDLDL